MAKIGIMSFAHMHAYGYAASLGQVPNAQFTAVWDDDAKRGRDAAKQFGARFIPKLDQFLDSDIDGVIVTSENMRHREMVEAAAAAGKWILCEKPLAPAVEDAKAMIQACSKAKVGLGTAFPCRYIPALMVARAQIQAGLYGEIYAACCTNHGQNPGGWFSDPKQSGGGATMDHTVHVADLLRWILDREFTKVYCEYDNVLHGKSLKTDDLGCVHLEMEGGVQVSHIASWSRAKSFPIWGDVTIEFIGEKGVLNVDAFNQKIDIYSDTDMRHTYAPWGDNSDLGLVRDFCDAIDEGREPTVTGEDGLRATEVTVAAYKAMKAGRMIKV